MMVGNEASTPLDVEALYRRHHRQVYALAWSILKNQDEALDAVHDAYVKVMRSAERFEGRSTTFSWLYRITVNVCIDMRRKKRRVYEQGLDEATERRSAAPRSSAFEPGAALEAGELRRAIDQSIHALSKPHQEVIVMRELQGMTYEQIAEGIDCPKGTVMSRLFHARRKLRSMLGDTLEMEPAAETAACAA